MEAGFMDKNNTYPDVNKKSFTLYDIRNILLWILVAGLISCGIVNLCVGGRPWFLYVLGAEIIFFVIFVYHPLVDHSFIQKFFLTTLLVCAYLLMIDYLNGNEGWSSLVVPIVCFSSLIVLGIMFFLYFQKQKQNFVSIYTLVFGSMIAVIMGIFGLFTINWPLIVLGSLALALFIISIVIFLKPLKRELKKKFHVK
ncbi:MAG: DUF6320 domain-containing protein [Eubacteriales bacterium]